MKSGMIPSKQEKRCRMRAFRVSDSDWEKIKKQADKYAYGNVSEFLRYIALNWGK